MKRDIFFLLFTMLVYIVLCTYCYLLIVYALTVFFGILHHLSEMSTNLSVQRDEFKKCIIFSFSESFRNNSFMYLNEKKQNQCVLFCFRV